MPLPSPEERRRRRWEGTRLTLGSAVFVAIGTAIGEGLAWYATAFFALCMVAGILTMVGVLPTKRMLASVDHLTIDDVGITRTAPKLREHVAWEDITRVRILTSDSGPYVEDVFFVIDGKDGNGCVVAHDLAVRSKLLEALQARFPTLDNGGVIRAMGSTTNQVFTIWESTARIVD